MANTKIPVELSSTPGIVDNSNATAITIDSSENITAVGTLTLDTGTNGVPTIDLKHSNANADNFRIQGGITGVANSGMSIRDIDASANRLTIDTSGNVSIVGGNLVMGTSGKGIDFSATGGGINSSSANGSLFDDYEEGTWSPTAAGVATAASYGARYTKIGQLVMAECYILIANQNNTNQFRIGGLPYTSHNVTAYGGGSIGYVGSSNLDFLTAPLIPGNASYAYFHYIDGQNSGASVTNNKMYSIESGNQLFIMQCFYRTA